METKTADMIDRMTEACSSGVRSDEIRRVLKVIDDEEFPDELVKRLFSQPAQLYSLYDGLLKVLKSLSDSVEDCSSIGLSKDDPCGYQLSSLDTFLFELPQNQEEFEEEIKYVEDIDGYPIDDQNISLQSNPLEAELKSDVNHSVVKKNNTPESMLQEVISNLELNQIHSLLANQAKHLSELFDRIPQKENNSENNQAYEDYSSSRISLSDLSHHQTPTFQHPLRPQAILTSHLKTPTSRSSSQSSSSSSSRSSSRSASSRSSSSRSRRRRRSTSSSRSGGRRHAARRDVAGDAKKMKYRRKRESSSGSGSGRDRKRSREMSKKGRKRGSSNESSKSRHRR